MSSPPPPRTHVVAAPVIAKKASATLGRADHFQKWRLQEMELSILAVDAIDATINKAEFCYIGEMRKPNSELIEHDKILLKSKASR